MSAASTGYMAAENCNINKGDSIAVFGCGPVGQLAIKSAFMLGAEKVIGIDNVPERLSMAVNQGAIIIDDTHGEVLARLDELPAACKTFNDKADHCIKVVPPLELCGAC